MKYTPIFSILLFLLLLLSTSCVRKGCTSCYALNYDPKATLDDGNCDVPNRHRMGTYSVQDSTISPFQDVFFDSYAIRISQRHCEKDKLTIWGYANLSTFSGEANVECIIDGDSIFIPNQTLFADNEDSFDDTAVMSSVGYFKGDSIFFHFDYYDSFDPWYGDVWGVKN